MNSFAIFSRAFAARAPTCRLIASSCTLQSGATLSSPLGVLPPAVRQLSSLACLTDGVHGWAATGGLTSLRSFCRPPVSMLPPAARAAGHPAAAQHAGAAHFASGPQPRFLGGKMKPFSAFKRRFKLTGAGKIRCMRPGHVHKRSNKGRSQLQELSKTKVVHATWAKTMKRLGFVMRSF